MKKYTLQTRQLISGCAITLLFLCYIQYYLIKNTYHLTKSNYYKEVNNAITKIIEDPKISSSNENSFAALKKSFYQLAMKKNGRIASDTLVENFKKMNAILNRPSLLLLKSRLQQSPILRDIKYEFKFDSLIIETNGKVDSVFFKSTKPIHVLGTPISRKNAINIEHYLLTSRDYDAYEAGNVKQIITFKIWYSRNVDLSNERGKIFSRMLGVFIVALILILAITTLFFLIIFSLIKQKKIADIKTDLANNLTHELKTPLASLNIIVKSLNKKEVLENSKMFTGLIASLNRQNVRIQQTVDSILESSIYNNVERPGEKFEATGFLAHYFQDFKIETHKLEIDIENRKNIIYADKIKLNSVLNNVMENAIKYSPNGTTIKVKAYIQAQDFCIAIKDEGLGISKADQKKIFQKFYRVAEDKNIHTIKGLGLGLFISEQNIKYLNGSLTVKSELGKGSIFTIKIPIYAN